MSRTYPRYTLRALFCAMLFVAVLLAWRGAEIRRTRAQEDLVAKLRDVGALVFYDDEVTDAYLPSTTQHAWEHPISDTLVCSGWSRNVVCIHAGNGFTFDEMFQIFGQCDYADAQFKRHVIRNWETAMPASLLGELTVFAQLRRLHLEFTTYSDEALEDLAKLNSLEYLHLPETVSEAGVGRLRLALPQCKIVRGMRKEADKLERREEELTRRFDEHRKRGDLKGKHYFQPQ